MPVRAAETISSGGPRIEYTVEINGAPGDGVESLLRETSQLIRLQDDPPATWAALGRRIHQDEQRFQAALESEGYYGAAITVATADEGGRTAIVVRVDPGPRYVVAAIEFDHTRENPDRASLIKPENYQKPLGRMVGKPARAADVILAEDAALDLLRANGFPFAQRGDRQLTVDHESNTIAVNLPVALGHKAVFGETAFSGLEEVNASHMRKLLPWRQGQIFSMDSLRDYREDLVLASLFTSVLVEPAASQVPEDGFPLDVNVIVTESRHHSVGAGLTYGRDEGFGGSVYWRDRNLFGNGERFEAALDGSQLRQTAQFALEKPAFLQPRQTLKLGTAARHADTEAFKELSGSVHGGLQREFGELWRVAAGTTFEFAALTEDGDRRNSYLAGLPLGLSRGIDERVLVEMTDGWRLQVNAVPYLGRYAGTVAFVHLETEVSGYLPVLRDDVVVLAGRIKLGSLLGKHTDEIPAHKRFYAGGGGSIRGFGYQLVGPLDVNNKPMGGRGVIESSFEARIRISDTIGIVPFIDAGIVSRHGLPGQDGDIRLGAGIGARYYTGAGPLRADIAIPVNRRGSVDKSFQFYISFGQAF